MAKDLFEGLGGLVKGLSSFMPQDDPDVKLFNAQAELTERTCPECGASVEQGIRFCGSCGHRMEE